MSLFLQSLVSKEAGSGGCCYLVARKGSSVEPRNSELGYAILHALECLVAAEGEQNRVCLFVCVHEGGQLLLPFQEFLFQFFLMKE